MTFQKILFYKFDFLTNLLYNIYVRLRNKFFWKVNIDGFVLNITIFMYIHKNIFILPF